MNRRAWKRLAVGIALSASSLTTSVAFERAAVGAQEPEVLTATKRTEEWTGTAGVPDPAHDPNGPCDAALGCAETLVDVQIDPAWWEGQSGAMRVEVKPLDAALADFDVHLYEVDNDTRTLIASGTRKPSEVGDRAAVGRPSGQYVVRVVTVALLEPAGYRVTAEIGEGHEFASSVFGIIEWSPKEKKDVYCENLSAKTLYENYEQEQEDKKSDVEVFAAKVHSCTGFFQRPGKPPLFGRVMMPADATGPLPTLVLFHGWKGNSGHTIGVYTNGCLDADLCIPQLHHNNALWFASRGYAVITYSARGHGSSCGFDVDPPAPATGCERGWTHFADRRAEVQDAMDLLALAVDAGISDAARLGATGESYGGGQTWLLATTSPDEWVTRRGTKLQLGAAAPNIGWTSFQSSLAPNGRATDGPGAAAPNAATALESPYGVLKKGWVDELINSARDGEPIEQCAYLTPLCTRGQVRLNETDPAEFHSHATGWQSFWAAGEPYDQSPLADDYVSAFRGKSAYNGDTYLEALAAGRARPVPIFAVSGWTDTLFPPAETVQMYRRLEAARRDYPMWMVFNDTGHGASGRAVDHIILANERRSDFFDRHLLGYSVDLGPKVQSLRTVCTGPADTDALRVPTWEKLSDGRLTLTADDTKTVVHDPALETPALEAGGAFGVACAAHDHTPGSARWAWTVDKGAVLVGLPSVSVGYTLTGTDATVAAKVWDVDATGAKQLVTRGVYRLTSANDGSTGTLSFQLFGNHWHFRTGHRLVLELALSDAPFFQTNRLASAVSFSSPTVSLPTSTHPKAF